MTTVGVVTGQEASELPVRVASAVYEIGVESLVLALSTTIELATAALAAAIVLIWIRWY